MRKLTHRTFTMTNCRLYTAIYSDSNCIFEDLVYSGPFKCQGGLQSREACPAKMAASASVCRVEISVSSRYTENLKHVHNSLGMPQLSFSDSKAVY